MDLSDEEIERRKHTAEWLKGERERYEYLLQCAAAAEREELAWETIVARMNVEDFVVAGKEVLAAREVVKAARKLNSSMNWITETEDAETIARNLEEAVRAYDQATRQP